MQVIVLMYLVGSFGIEAGVADGTALHRAVAGAGHDPGLRDRVEPRAGDGLTTNGQLGALDVETERLVQDAIEKLRGDRVVLVVAHRTSTIRRADRVLLLDGGRIVEDGPVGEVAARSARFRELTGIAPGDVSAGARAPRAARP